MPSGRAIIASKRRGFSGEIRLALVSKPIWSVTGDTVCPQGNGSISGLGLCRFQQGCEQEEASSLDVAGGWRIGEEGVVIKIIVVQP